MKYITEILKGFLIIVIIFNYLYYIFPIVPQYIEIYLRSDFETVRQQFYPELKAVMNTCESTCQIYYIDSGEAVNEKSSYLRFNLSYILYPKIAKIVILKDFDPNTMKKDDIIVTYEPVNLDNDNFKFKMNSFTNFYTYKLL